MNSFGLLGEKMELQGLKEQRCASKRLCINGSVLKLLTAFILFFNSYAASAFLFFPVPDANGDLDYPYYNDFDTGSSIHDDATDKDSANDTNGREDWEVLNDWGISSNFSLFNFFSNSYHLDNNITGGDQYGHVVDQTASLKQYINIPVTSQQPVLSYTFQLELLHYNDIVRVQVQIEGQTTWENIKSYKIQHNRGGYTKETLSLEQYKGSNIRIRFKQEGYWSTGARLFAVDDFSVADLNLPVLGYPYFNSLETADEQSHWDLSGLFSFADALNQRTNYDGVYHLDNNHFEVDQNGFVDEQYSTLNNFINIPTTSQLPTLSYWYKVNMLDNNDVVDVQVQEKGNSLWTTVTSYKLQHNKLDYTREDLSLEDYKGKDIRIRFKQSGFWSVGARLFVVDTLSITDFQATNIAYPYSSGFETASEAQWNLSGSWDMSTTHGEWATRSGLQHLDNNPNELNQYGFVSTQSATLDGYINVPLTSNLPTLKYWYKLGLLDYNDAIKLQIQTRGSFFWTTIKEYKDQHNRNEHSLEEISLEAYKGTGIRIRFIQTGFWTVGPRLFVVDDLTIDDQQLANITYPYTTGFETAEDKINWSFAGSWDIAAEHTAWTSETGIYHLDNNPAEINQYAHIDYHTATLNGLIEIPLAGQRPTLAYSYKLNLLDNNDRVKVQVQTESSAEWVNLPDYTAKHNHADYVREEISLEAYKGQKIRIRFAQSGYWSTGSRLFVIDNLKIADFSLPNLALPYETSFEDVNTLTEWSLQGLWSVASAHGTWQSNTGIKHLDSNAGELPLYAHLNRQSASLQAYLTIPVKSQPVLSFNHRLNLGHNTHTFVVEIQTDDSNDWTLLKEYTELDNNTAYTLKTLSLDLYTGKNIRLRFRQFIGWTEAISEWTVDDIKVYSVDTDIDGVADRFDLCPATPQGQSVNADGCALSQLDSDNDGVMDDVDVFPLDPTESSDLDHDGIGDNADLDRDGDGISNDYEIQVGTNPNDGTSTPPDFDNDGIPDSVDTDRDGDGVLNTTDAFPDDPAESSDIDNDGVGDNADTDRDGDGISNDYEIQVGTNPSDPTSTPADLDNDGIPDSVDTDRDGDGVLNTTDVFPDDATETTDLDNDGIGDNADTDRDGDGISNDYEIQVGTNPNDGTNTPPDLDADGIPDSVDTDRDGDGVLNTTDVFPDDPAESADLDNDGIGDNADTDRDGDGISNDYETQVGTNPDDGTSTPPDLDADGIPDSVDTDRDGDGVENTLDVFPDDATETTDLDNDGIGDNADTDRDGDGISNDYEIQVGTNPNDGTSTPPDLDADGIPDSVDTDRDGDGVENTLDVFPDDPAESADLDNDGIGDNADTDRDGDGISNDYEIQVGTNPNDGTSTPPDLDTDGIPDSVDTDRDGDGVENTLDVFPDDATETTDLDNDGIGDNADTDRDGDGISNDYETQVGTNPNDGTSTPPDLDTDGIPDSVDTDRDGDGVENTLDVFPDDATETTDLDNDGIGDNADTDRDGDGISNDYEIQVGTNPNDGTSTPPDLDADGIPDSVDTDRDGDGVLNTTDVFPDDPAESADLDNDGIGDNADTDRDGDGISNDYEIQVGTNPNDGTSTPPDLDADGIPDSVDTDRDGDGVLNTTDIFPDDPAESADLDNDGIGDNADTDRDGDGISNDYETQLATDPNDASSTPPDLDADGIPDSLDTDRDGDGVLNTTDVFPDDATETTDLDNDGIGDNADTDRDGDGISNDYEIQVGTNPDDATSTPPDLDADGIPDSVDTDLDGDGVANDVDLFPLDATESSDIDGDGTGDNADLDRDGDGVTNQVEIDAGTDPSNPADFPDAIPPTISFDIASDQTTQASSIQLSGTVTDDGSGLASLVALSDGYAGTTFNPLLNQSFWTLDIPLQLGSNTITLVALDVAGNRSEQSIKVDRQQANIIIDLHVDNPIQNSVFTEPLIIVTGRVISEEEIQTLSVSAGGQNATVTATSQATVWAYTSPDVSLTEGVNNITVSALINGKQLQRQLTVVYQPAQTVLEAPVFVDVTPASNTYINTDSVTVNGELDVASGIQSLTINNLPYAVESGASKVFFEKLLNISVDAQTLSVTLQATDLLGQTTELSLLYNRDAQDPQIIVDNAIAALPVENKVTETPYHLVGRIIDENLSSASLNGQPINLQASATAGEYTFDLPLAVSALSANIAHLTAYDFAGNSSNVKYSLQLEFDLSAELLRPYQNQQWEHNNQPVDVLVAVRLSQALADITAEAVVVDANGVETLRQPLTLEGALISGQVILPALQQTYTLTVEIKDQFSTLLTQTTGNLKVIDPVPVPMAVDKITPADNSTGVEPNQFISVFFNQAVDDTKLVLEVYETAHGLTYLDMDVPGTDAIKSLGFKLQNVNRDHEVVPGAISLLPTNDVIVFSPSRSIAYNADVYVNVIYDGATLQRLHYKTRPLPTFIEGGVLDQLGQPLAGVEVFIEELNKRTTTNSDGYYYFGYDAAADQIIKTGLYRLIVNNGLKKPAYGNNIRWINIQQGTRHILDRVILPVLNRDIAFSYIENAKTNVINGGEVQLELADVNTRLIFPDTKNNGSVHIQFTGLGQMSHKISEKVSPIWSFAVQPMGIKVEGNLQLSFSVPTYEGSHENSPRDNELVVLLGVDYQSNTMLPVGVGRSLNYRIQSEGITHYELLDEIAYSRVFPDQQKDLQAYLNGDISLPELVSLLQSFVFVPPENLQN